MPLDIKHKKFLDALQESGKVNMYGAGRVLMLAFSLTKEEANEILKTWIKEY